MRKRVQRVIICVMLGVALSGLWCRAQADKAAPLAGLPSLKIVVEVVPPDLERLGYTENWIQQRVELKLRMARIPISESSGELRHQFPLLRGCAVDSQREIAVCSDLE
jgi:hypothetical protein